MHFDYTPGSCFSKNVHCDDSNKSNKPFQQLITSAPNCNVGT